MAINKVVNRSVKSHGAMRNVIEYVLRDEKVRGGYVDITGPFDSDTINFDLVYNCWLREKRIWGKDSGRMYAHNVISFHKDEQVTPVQVLDIGRKFAEEFFQDYQNLIAVHQDKEHLHCHIVTNSVSYMDGHKLHQTKKELQTQKLFTNKLCAVLGLTVARKGHHFDGTPIEEGQILSWNKNKFKLLADSEKKSYIVDCAVAAMESAENSLSREEFIENMMQKGWNVSWKDGRKHIVFSNREGKKVRDSNLSKTFNLDISKEALTLEFERQRKLNRYSTEISSINFRSNSQTTVGFDSGIAGKSEQGSCRIGRDKEDRETRRCRKDKKAHVRK